MAFGIDDLIIFGALAAGGLFIASNSATASTSSSINAPTVASLKTYPNEQNPPLIYDPIVDLLPSQQQLASRNNPITNLSTTQISNGQIVASNALSQQQMVQSAINTQSSQISNNIITTTNPAVIDYLNSKVSLTNEINSQHLGSYVPVPGLSNFAYGLNASGQVVSQPLQNTGSIISTNPAIATGNIQAAGSAYIGPGYYQAANGSPSYITSFTQYQDQISLGYLGSGNPANIKEPTQTVIATPLPVIQSQSPSNNKVTTSTTSTTVPNNPVIGTTTTSSTTTTIPQTTITTIPQYTTTSTTSTTTIPTSTTTIFQQLVSSFDSVINDINSNYNSQNAVKSLISSNQNSTQIKASVPNQTSVYTPNNAIVQNIGGSFNTYFQKIFHSA
ncbi:MAG: hypothetical protein ACREBJ_04620 [Nitrosotalea sp.]